MKARITKDYREYKKGQVYEVTPNILHGLIELGVATVDKMLDQYPTAKIVKRKKK